MKSLSDDNYLRIIISLYTFLMSHISVSNHFASSAIGRPIERYYVHAWRYRWINTAIKKKKKLAEAYIILWKIFRIAFVLLRTNIYRLFELSLNYTANLNERFIELSPTMLQLHYVRFFLQKVHYLIWKYWLYKIKSWASQGLRIWNFIHAFRPV